MISFWPKPKSLSSVKPELYVKKACEGFKKEKKYATVIVHVLLKILTVIATRTKFKKKCDGFQNG